MRKLIYYVATSVDGFIAGPGGDVSFLGQSPETLAAIFAEYPETCPVQAREHFGVTGEPRHFDTVVMGRATQQPGLDIGLVTAYPHLANYVISRQRNLPEHAAVTYVLDDPIDVVRRLKSQPGKDIWLCGGGETAGLLADEIDKLHLKVSPAIVGSGTPLAVGAGIQSFAAESSRPLPGGVRLDVYRRAED